MSTKDASAAVKPLYTVRRTDMKPLGVICMVSTCVALLLPSAPHLATARAQEPVVIGVPTSLGTTAGKEALNSVIMATEEINARGGVHVKGSKRKLHVESIDIRDASPGVPVPEALLGLEKIIMDKKAHAIVVGFFRSEALLAGMDILSKQKVPMLGTIAMTPASEEKIKQDPTKYKYIFRTGINVKYFAGYQMGIMKKLKDSFGFDKVFIMHQDVLWARGAAAAFAGALPKSGWTVLGTEAYPTGASDFSVGLMKAQAAGTQVILPIFDMPEAGILVKQWQSMKVPALFAGIIVPLAGSEAWKAFEGKIVGVTNMFFEVGNIPAPKLPASVRYFENYRKRWNAEVQEQHGPAPSYESVYILAEAIEKAGTLDGDAVAEAIAMTDRVGTIGRIKFDEGHQAVFGMDPAQSAVGGMMQWREGGKRVIVFPESIADDRILLPPWMKAAK
jgi:branched-chain amino acid transport system substrate-binding protein